MLNFDVFFYFYTALNVNKWTMNTAHDLDIIEK